MENKAFCQAAAPLSAPELVKGYCPRATIVFFCINCYCSCSRCAQVDAKINIHDIPMKLILISNPVNLVDELETIVRMFESGLTYFHLRKPDFTKEEYELFLKAIPLKYRKYIIIHHYHELIYHYELQGIHHTRRTNFQPIQLQYKVHQSKSFHSISEIKHNQFPYDYVFLSPIYDSISKQGYRSNFDFSTLADWLSRKPHSFKIVALGGINENNLAEVKQIGFDGVAILGIIWNEVKINKRLEKFKTIQAKIENLN
jgi:thiamine-phosphate pyrophosphorylase